MVKVIDTILEEGKNEQRTIRSSVRAMLQHMLKCKYQNEYPNKQSWRSSVFNSFNTIDDAFEGKRKGSLYKKFYLRDLDLEVVYKQAVRLASNETGKSMETFPEKCEWTKSQLVDEEFIDNFIKKYGQDIK